MCAIVPIVWLARWKQIEESYKLKQQEYHAALNKRWISKWDHTRMVPIAHPDLTRGINAAITNSELNAALVGILSSIKISIYTPRAGLMAATDAGPALLTAGIAELSPEAFEVVVVTNYLRSNVDQLPWRASRLCRMAVISTLPAYTNLTTGVHGSEPSDSRLDAAIVTGIAKSSIGRVSPLLIEVAKSPATGKYSLTRLAYDVSFAYGKVP